MGSNRGEYALFMYNMRDSRVQLWTVRVGHRRTPIANTTVPDLYASAGSELANFMKLYYYLIMPSIRGFGRCEALMP